MNQLTTSVLSRNAQTVVPLLAPVPICRDYSDITDSSMGAKTVPYIERSVIAPYSISSCHCISKKVIVMLLQLEHEFDKKRQKSFLFLLFIEFCIIFLLQSFHLAIHPAPVLAPRIRIIVDGKQGIQISFDTVKLLNVVRFGRKHGF